MRTRRDPSKRILINLSAIAGQFGFTLEQVRGKKAKMRPLLEARIACYRWLREQGWTYPQIGWLFDRDHSSVAHQTDPQIMAKHNARVLARYHEKKLMGARRI